MIRRNFIRNNVLVGLGVMADPKLAIKLPETAVNAGNDSYDVVLFGGTPSGIVTSVRLAREGYKVALVSAYEHLGGTLINGLSVMDTMYDGNRAPLYEEILASVRIYYKELYGEKSEQYAATFFGEHKDGGKSPRFEPHAMEKVFDKMLRAESNITILKKYEIASVNKKGTMIRSVVLQEMGRSAQRTVTAPIFIDSSYEGDLAAKASVEYFVGREGRADYNEQYAGKMFTLRGKGDFPYEASHQQLNLRTFPLVTVQVFAGSTGTGDRAVQAYNARFILTDDPAKKIEIKKPAGYKREVYLGITDPNKLNSVKPYPLKADLLLVNPAEINPSGSRLLNNKFGNNLGNFTGMNWEYPDADWRKRETIAREHIDHGLGLLYFLQYDETVPEAVRTKARTFGLCSDEFADNGFVPYEIYVREARRIRGRYVFTENDGTLADGIERAPIHHDSIAITEWPMDSHDCSMERKPGSLNDGLLLLSEKSRPGQVPYRVLLPKTIDNLLVTVCLSATHIGWGTIRVEPTFMHIAESAAYACVLALKQKRPPASINPYELQRMLVEKKIMLSFFNEFDMSADEPWVKAMQYLGTKGFFTSYHAKPSEMLTQDEADSWLANLQGLLAGQVEPLKNARELHRKAGVQPGSNPANANAFISNLNNLVKQAGIIVPGKETGLLKKDAAIMIYKCLTENNERS